MGHLSKGILPLAVMILLLIFLVSRIGSADDGLGSIGTVLVNGLTSFDSNSIARSERNQWRWLSVPQSRIVLNPTNNYQHLIGPMKPDLGLHVGYWYGWRMYYIENIMAVSLSAQENGAAVYASSLRTTWYPYQITFDASYNSLDTTIRGRDFFRSQNSVVRILDVDYTNEAPFIELSGEVPDGNPRWDTSREVIIVENSDFFYALAFAPLVGSDWEPVDLHQRVTVDAHSWRLSIDANRLINNKFAIAVGFSTHAEGSSCAIFRAKDCLAVGTTTLSEELLSRKDYWDNLLASVPTPMSFGIEAVDPGIVTPELHRTFYYGAWVFTLMNMIEPMPENEYPFPQTPTGKPCNWTTGPPRARASAAWESLFAQQLLGHIMPDEAFSAFEGLMSEVEQNGDLPGESLPSRKAQTAWILYRLTGDKARLTRTYPDIKRYLLWREQHPHHDPPSGMNAYYDLKDSCYVTALISDLHYARKIARAVHQYGDIEMWANLRRQVIENYRVWFFYEDGTPPAGEYYESTGKRFPPSVAHEGYVLKGLYLQDLPRDLFQDLKDYYFQVHDPLLDLVGFTYLKFPEANFVAHGLLDNGMQDDGWEFIDAAVKDAIYNGEFCESLWRADYIPHGAKVTMFTAALIIDFTLLKNGVRRDYGGFRVLDPVRVADIELLGDPVAEAKVAFSHLVDSNTFDVNDFELTRNGRPIHFMEPIWIKRTSSTSCSIKGLDILTASPGTYTLSVCAYNVQDANGVYGADSQQVKWWRNESPQDINLDDYVDFFDFALLASEIGSGRCKQPDWCSQRDTNHDGSVTIRDFNMIAQSWLAGER